MDQIPQEILMAVAEALPSALDIGNFRLVCHRFAHAGFPALFRSISILDIAGDIHELEALKCSPFGSLGTAKHLTIYSGTWPFLTSLQEWYRHPLFLGGARRRRRRSRNYAFNQYLQFVERENRRMIAPDVTWSSEVLETFPTLTTLSIRHVHAWSWKPHSTVRLANLLASICMLPYFHCFVATTVFRVLPALNASPQVTRLDIHGTFHPETPHEQYPSIRFLRIRSLVSSRQLRPKIQDFLASFPNLVGLSLTLEAAGYTSELLVPLDALNWEHLEHFSLKTIWISENELFRFIERHSSSLRKLSLDKITLVQGSWASFFTRFRDLANQPDIKGKAVLSAIGSSSCVVYPRYLDAFLSRKNAWPFSEVEPETILPAELDLDLVPPFELE